jgi:hypothetical protein
MVLIVDTNKNFTRLLVLKDVRDSFFPCENEKKNPIWTCYPLFDFGKANLLQDLSKYFCLWNRVFSLLNYGD